MSQPETTLLFESLRPEALPDAPGGRGKAFLVEIYGGEIGRLHPLAGTVTIGRDEGSDIAVDLPTVSRSHAAVERREGGFVVRDLRSTNGTFVNEVELVGEVELRSGDLLQVGGAIFKLIAGSNLEVSYYEEIYRLTIVDGLTGLHNRRYLLDFLDREVARASRHDRPLSVALLDVDHFKEVNDTHGHLAGDAVLRDLARRLGADVRRDELLARYGGEELALVLPETDRAGALQLCERLRRNVAGTPFVVDGAAIALSISVGVATLAESGDVDALLALADRRLYAAKEAGRDRVVAAGDVPDATPITPAAEIPMPTNPKSTPATSYRPDGYHDVIPYLIVADPDAEIAFLERAFGATAASPPSRDPEGRVAHADLLIGDSHVMLGGANDKWPPIAGSIYLYVEDADAAYRAAMDAGATSIFEPSDMFYGDRNAGVRSPGGTSWWIGTHIEDVAPDEMARRSEEEMRRRAAADKG